MTNIPAGLDRKRVQENGSLFHTVSTAPDQPHVGLGAFADAAGNPHFTVGACQSLEGNTFRPVLEIDFAAALVKINGVTLVVP